jgi:hypothetical protein
MRQIAIWITIPTYNSGTAKIIYTDGPHIRKNRLH